MSKQPLALIFAAATVALATFADGVTYAAPTASTIEKYGRVAVITPEEILHPKVQSNLQFTPRLIAGAKQIMETQRVSQLLAIRKLASKGAVRVKVELEKDWNTGALELLNYSDKNTFKNWHFVGYSSKSNAIGRSETFPVQANNYANYLTKPVLSDCSPLAFNIFNPATWFGDNVCNVDSPPAEEFLRAALASYLVKSGNNIGGWELQQLAFCLEPHHQISIQSGALFCPDLAKDFGGTTRIPLTQRGSLGGYSFSVDLKSRTAKFAYIAPDQQMMADKARKVSGQPWIDFGR